MALHLRHQQAGANTVDLNVAIVSTYQNESFRVSLVSPKHQNFVWIRLLISFFVNFAVIDHVPELREDGSATAVFIWTLLFADLPNANFSVVTTTN